MINLSIYKTHNSVEDLRHTEKEAIKVNKIKGNVLNTYKFLVGKSLTINNLGACTYKVANIAEKLNISLATVTRCIKRLKDLFLIEVVNKTKGNGIKGANVYRILPVVKNDSHECNFFYPSNEVSSEVSEEVEMSYREVHGNTRSSKVENVNLNNESLSFNHSFNPFVVSNVVNNVNACDTHDLKSSLRNIWNPQDDTQHKEFNELCKIAFGRLKQYMKEKSIPYMQMQQIIIQCMKSLIVKDNVRNKFALFSAMIKRQVEQLFESNIMPVSNGIKDLKSKSKEIIPDWFEGRKSAPVQSDDVGIDFEAERKKILNQLGGC